MEKGARGESKRLVGEGQQDTDKRRTWCPVCMLISNEFNVYTNQFVDAGRGEADRPREGRSRSVQVKHARDFPI